MGLSMSVFGNNRSENPNLNLVGRQGEEGKSYAATLRDVQRDDEDNYIEALAGLCSPPIPCRVPLVKFYLTSINVLGGV